MLSPGRNGAIRRGVAALSCRRIHGVIFMHPHTTASTVDRNRVCTWETEHSDHPLKIQFHHHHHHHHHHRHRQKHSQFIRYFVQINYTLLIYIHSYVGFCFFWTQWLIRTTARPHAQVSEPSSHSSKNTTSSAEARKRSLASQRRPSSSSTASRVEPKATRSSTAEILQVQHLVVHVTKRANSRPSKPPTSTIALDTTIQGSQRDAAARDSTPKPTLTRLKS